MLPKLCDAQYDGEYRIRVAFADGTEGVIDFADELWGEVFEPLKEMTLFAGFSVSAELGTLVWPNGADFAPEFLYQKLHPDYRLGSAATAGAA